MRYSEQLEKMELRISQCESQKEFEQLVQDNLSFFDSRWKARIEFLNDAKGLTPTQIATGCQVSYSTANSFLTKIPTKRHNVIMLAMMLGLAVEETDDLLIHYANYQRLYPKNPEDAICIYLLQHGGSQEPAALFGAYKAQYELIKSGLIRKARTSSSVDTDIAMLQIMNTASSGGTNSTHDPRFTEMMQRLLPSFEVAYQKLLKFIELYFPYLEQEDALDQGLVELEEALQNRNRGLFGRKKNGKRKQIANKRMSANEKFDDDYKFTYYKNIKRIEKKHEIPSRTFLVSLGAHLNMGVSQINQMLDLAGMGPLCAGDKIEAAVIYYLEELNCQIPTYFYCPRELRTDPVYDQLQVFSLKDELARIRRTDLPGSDSDGSDCFWSNIDEVWELPPEHLNDYLKRKLAETNIFEKHDQKALEKLLNLL